MTWSASTEPMIATPSAEPSWRVVEEAAATTPACSRGIPATAVLVIAALSQPRPAPISA
ncbi:MAG: hypothetical protein JSS68_05250 [Actinobacteria bacterium]|nr:hypothetical protein [Actinomycetota bacterium]